MSRTDKHEHLIPDNIQSQSIMIFMPRLCSRRLWMSSSPFIHS